jgi:TolB-like protein/Flp pilus assembly protein TadD
MTMESVSAGVMRLPSSDTARPRSIVVLPFANIGGDKEHDYFSDGLTEDLTDALANLEGLRVASRTSAFDPKLQNRDIREIATRLNVDTVLQGSVRMAGGRLRVSAQLINGADGYHIWSQRFDRQMADVFEVQDEIARAIADKLRGTLVSSSPAPLIKRYTDDVDAYNLYLKGRYYWNRRYEGGIQKALTYFNQALERSRGYALADSGVADCFSILAFYNYVSPREGFGKAEVAAQKALAIDEELAEAHTSLGLVRTFFDWDFEAGEREFRRSIQLNPRYGTAHYWYGLHEIVVGRSASAIASLKRASEAEPLSVNFNGGVALLSYYARQYDEAIDAAQRTLELEPLFGPAHAFLGWTYAQQGKYEDAIAEWQQTVTVLGGAPAAVASLAQIYALAGQRTEALKILHELDELRSHRYVSSYHVAAVHVALQQNDQAMAWLERAQEERSNWLPFIRVDPMLDPLRGHQRFRSIEASVFQKSAKV